MSVIGPIIGGDDVADAVLAHLEKWMPTYLAEVARQRGLPADTFPQVKTYDLQAIATRLPEWDAPVVSVTPLDTDRITGGSQHTVNAGTLVQVNTYVEATDQRSTLRLAARYTAAARAAVLQHPTLDGFATDTQWIRETFRGLDIGDGRFRGGGALVIRVHVPAVINLRTDLRDPLGDPTDPPPDPPLHTSSTVIFDL